MPLEMGLVTKTYIDKTNTLIRNSHANSGSSPIMELNYGFETTRGILYFDHEKVKALVEDKTYADISKLKHTLKITNAGSAKYVSSRNKPYKPNNSDNEKDRAISFELIFFLINKPWDSGNGFDYDADLYNKGVANYSTDASTWYNRQNYIQWDEEGVYSLDTLAREYEKFTSPNGNTSNIIFASQKFDHGNENIELDITDLFNKFLNGELKNYGIGIAFAPQFEQVRTNRSQYIGFYTGYTHTFFEPYVETIYNDNIDDDRSNFILNKKNKLYFYALIDGNYVNFDKLPTCKIKEQEYPVKQATKGVYYIEVEMSRENVESDVMFYDVWSDISYNGVSFPDVELQFVTKEPTSYFTFGLPKTDDNVSIKPSLYGISAQERIKRGDIRRVNVDCKIPYTTNQLKAVEGLDYRIYVNIGSREYDVVSWQPLERGYNENYFFVNTMDFIPYRYNVDIRVKRNRELIIHNDLLEFDIVDDLTKCLV